MKAVDDERSRLMMLISEHYPELMDDFSDVFVSEEADMPRASGRTLNDFTELAAWPDDAKPSHEGKESTIGASVK